MCLATNKDFVHQSSFLSVEQVGGYRKVWRIQKHVWAL